MVVKAGHDTQDWREMQAKARKINSMKGSNSNVPTKYAGSRIQKENKYCIILRHI
jgi:hypothetical protein